MPIHEIWYDDGFFHIFFDESGARPLKSLCGEKVAVSDNLDSPGSARNLAGTLTCVRCLHRVIEAALPALRGQQLTSEQTAPTPNEGPPVWDLVMADMRERDAEGRRRYGTPLQPFNGRKPLVDAYQEALDQVVYLRQEIYEREGR